MGGCCCCCRQRDYELLTSPASPGQEPGVQVEASVSNSDAHASTFDDDDDGVRLVDRAKFLKNASEPAEEDECISTQSAASPTAISQSVSIQAVCKQPILRQKEVTQSVYDQSVCGQSQCSQDAPNQPLLEASQQSSALKDSIKQVIAPTNVIHASENSHNTKRQSTPPQDVISLSETTHDAPKQSESPQLTFSQSKQPENSFHQSEPLNNMLNQLKPPQDAPSQYEPPQDTPSQSKLPQVAISQSKPSQDMLSESKHYQDILSQSKPSQDMLSESKHSQDILSQSKPPQDTLGQSQAEKTKSRRVEVPGDELSNIPFIDDMPDYSSSPENALLPDAASQSPLCPEKTEGAIVREETADSCTTSDLHDGERGIDENFNAVTTSTASLVTRVESIHVGIEVVDWSEGDAVAKDEENTSTGTMYFTPFNSPGQPPRGSQGLGMAEAAAVATRLESLARSRCGVEEAEEDVTLQHEDVEEEATDDMGEIDAEDDESTEGEEDETEEEKTPVGIPNSPFADLT